MTMIKFGNYVGTIVAAALAGAAIFGSVGIATYAFWWMLGAFGG